jgi:phage RecT family recombinase
MSNLTLTTQALAAPKDLKGVFEIEAFRNNFVSNFVKTTGINAAKGELIFEREKILFMKAIAGNKELEQCDRFSIYSSFIELAVSGCSLNEGEAYIIPYSGKAQFQIGYKGRINQMAVIPGVEYVHMPQVVYSCDVFEYELGDNPKVIKHAPAKTRGKNDIITHVYMIVDREPTPTNPKAKEMFIMDREQVISIRDRYSKPYRYYMADCARLNKTPGDTFKKTIQGKNGGNPFEVLVEPPMWVSSEAEAWKKTIAKRAYKWMPKTARQKALDAKIAANFDPEDGTGGEQEIDYGIVNNDGTTTDVKAEATQQTKAETPAAEKTEKAKKPAAAKAEVKPADDIRDIASAVIDEQPESPAETGVENPLEGY